jgi:hypothetical protein
MLLTDPARLVRAPDRPSGSSEDRHPRRPASRSRRRGGAARRRRRQERKDRLRRSVSFSRTRNGPPRRSSPSLVLSPPCPNAHLSPSSECAT